MATSTSLLWVLGFSAVLSALVSQHEQVQAHHPYAGIQGGVDLQQVPVPVPVPVPAAAPPTPAPLNCTSACGFRCSEAGRTRVCMRACETCCDRCHCVPPGTSGNHHVCGACYVNQTTHGGKSKCP